MYIFEEDFEDFKHSIKMQNFNIFWMNELSQLFKSDIINVNFHVFEVFKYCILILYNV